LAAFDGQDTASNPEEFAKLEAMVDEFTRQVDHMHALWGHRLEAAGKTP